MHQPYKIWPSAPDKPEKIVFSYFAYGEIKNVEPVQLARLLIEALETAFPDKRTEYKLH